MDEKDFDELENDAQKAVDDIQEDTRPKRRRMIQAWWAKFNEQLDKRRNLILFAIILAIVGLYINPTLPTISKMETVEQVKEAITVPKVKAGVFYTIDLEKMEVTDRKVVVLKDAEGKEVGKRFIVKRRLINDETKVSDFVTRKEPLEALNHNKSEYLKYLEQQALLEAKEVK